MSADFHTGLRSLMSTDPATMAGEINELNDMLSQRDARIRQLERLNQTLSAEIDRGRPVIEAAQGWYNGKREWSAALATAVLNYEQASPNRNE